MLSIPVANWLGFLGEYLVTLWLFGRIERRHESRWRWLGYICLAGMAWIYFSTQSATALVYSLQNFMAQLQRMAVHAAAVWGYLLLVKEVSWRKGIYLAGFSTLLYLLAQNVRLVLVLVQPIGANLENYRCFASCVAVLLELIVAAVTLRYLDKFHVHSIGLLRWSMLLLSIGIELYFRWMLIALCVVLPQGERGGELIPFACFASLSVFLTLFLFERSQKVQQEKTRIEMETLSQKYEMQNAKRAMQTNNDIRRLYHDMKNHLLAIQSMAGEKEDLNAYLQQLLPQIEGYETQVRTGDAVIDALLAEKIQRAKLDQIQFNVVVDLSGLKQVKSVDLVTVFGNATDNAIEAVQMLPEGFERIVYIKGSSFANMYVLRFSNQFSGQLEWKKELPVTQKRDAAMHGIGLSSIRKVVKRYGGSLSVQVDEEKRWFRLIVMLPLGEKE